MGRDPAVIVSWLTAFNVINVHNNFVRTVLRILYGPDRAGVPPGAQGDPAGRRAWTCRPSWCS